MIKRLYKKPGFTLIELLIVVGIIGILAGVTIMIINPIQQRNRARDGVLISTMAKMIAGVEAYNNYNNTYPLNEDCYCNTPGQCPAQPSCVIFNELPGATLYKAGGNPRRVWFTVTDIPVAPGAPNHEDAQGVFRYQEPREPGGACLAVRAFSGNMIYLWRPAIGANRLMMCDYSNSPNSNVFISPAAAGCNNNEATFSANFICQAL